MQREACASERRGIDFDATAVLQAYQVEITYPLGKGSFAGSADLVACTAGADSIFVANDRDDGTLTFARTYDIDVGDKTMWWMGMLALG